jgi:hypothetical protein
MTTSGTDTSRMMTDAVDSFSRFLNESTRISADLLDSYTRLLQSTLAGARSSEMMRSVTNAMESLRKAAPQGMMKSACGCHIPPPCWAPQPLGSIVSHVCPGATATLRLCVTNCGYTRRAIRIDVPLDSKITVTPPAFMLEQLERECSTLSVAVPADAAKDSEKEYLVWVRGCKNHYLRWTVKVSSRGGCSCHEVEVEDCPDLVHHWYDHFYCRRPCTNRTTEG